MAAAATLDVEHVRGLVAQVDSGAALAPESKAHMLEVFEHYECWGPFFRLLKRCIQTPGEAVEKDFILLARVQNLYLEDAFAAAETCSTLVAELKFGYQRFHEEVLRQIVEFEDFATEATILSAVAADFPTAGDHVACLERLCMIYEKKTHNETQLVKAYEQLLQIDPSNVKALRYFKLLFTQANEWDQVVETLKKLLAAVRHPQELFRVAQELAAIYLYQMDAPDEAIRVVEKYCADSPLDTSTILHDAYQRLADWEGCLRVLRQALLTVDAENSRAILHYKIGNLHAQLGSLDEALENQIKALKVAPEMIDAVEAIIGIGVQKRDWALIQTWLGNLGDQVIDERLRAQVKQAQTRLGDGLVHAAKRS